MNNKATYILIFSISLLFSNETLSDKYLQSIDVDNQLGNKVTDTIEIINQDNKKMALGDFFNNKKPIILLMAYYECPMLCSMVLNGLSEAIDKADLSPGDDFDVLTVSIDPTENPELSLKKKNNYMESYFKDRTSDFWTFSTATVENINKLTDEIGFRFSYDQSTKQYAHPAVIYILTPEGVISRQLFGIKPDPMDLTLAVNEASGGNVSDIYDKILLYCYRYDPSSGSYSLVATNVMKLAGVSTLLVIFSFLSFFWYREKRAR